MQSFGRFLGKIEKIQMAFCMFGIAGIAAVVSSEIILRNLLGITWIWTLELCALLTVWVGFLGASVVFRRKGHIGIEALVRLFPEKVQKAVNVSMYLVICAGFAVLIVKAAMLMILQAGQEIVSLGIPRSFLSLPIVLGIGLMFITSIYLILEELLGSYPMGSESKAGGVGEYDESY
jgi:TRAP-type C4-dicarboxylate transport system permease small subunit